jgi:hypothetical protein
VAFASKEWMIPKLVRIVAHEVERQALMQQIVLGDMVTGSCVAASLEEVVHRELERSKDIVDNGVDEVFGSVDEAADSATAWEVDSILDVDKAWEEDSLVGDMDVVAIVVQVAGSAGSADTAAADEARESPVRVSMLTTSLFGGHSLLEVAYGVASELLDRNSS